MPSSLRPPPWLPVCACLLAIAFCAGYAWSMWPVLTSADGPEATLLTAKVAAEMLFAFPAATMILVSLVYLLGRDRTAPTGSSDATPPIGVLYLSCGDLDRAALESLRRLRYAGELHLVVHDDLPGGDPRVDEIAATLANDPRLRFHLLRRPTKEGGKPGAINYVLEQVGDRFEFLLVCDNDSIALDPDCLPKLLAPMADPRIAVAQARNVAADDANYCGVNRVLSRAIDVFHLFLSVARRFGWTPFVGHNGLLRCSALRAAGGFTPGCFADDIDLTVRLNRKGFRVAYCGDVHFGEKHPPSYTAFRLRSYKWSYGSMQVLQRHLLPMLASREVTLAEKWGFLHFTGFYTMQTVLLVYVIGLYLVGPFVLDPSNFDIGASIVAGAVIPVLIFLPVIAFSLRNGRLRSLPSFVLTCWLGYGATDFPTARGTVHALFKVKRRWVPTNSVSAGGVDTGQIAEALFGVALLLVPLSRLPVMLLSPLTIVIAVKFLFIPTMSVLYRDGDTPPLRTSPRPLVALLTLVAVIGLLAAALPSQATTPTTVRADGKRLLVDESPYVVRGVHYGPWRPGTGPGRNPYPTRQEIETDLDMIVELNANTILVFDPPRYVLDAAAERGLLVLYAFWLEWPQLGTDAYVERCAECIAAVRELRDHPALFGWMLGNEVPTWLVTDRGPETVEHALLELYRAVKAIDPHHVVTHANWPNTRSLDLGFLDVCGFNVYALWPPEVVARGYGNFVRDVLQPIAGDRPLLLTEFGTNSLEAGLDRQAELDRRCWNDLRAAGARGGFVFAFADEWWKNYSNPKMAGAWWDREEVLDDHRAHDQDPEEHYGLVTGERARKPAFAAVQQMYAERDGRASSWVAGGVVAVIALAGASLVWSFWITGRRRQRVAPVGDGV